MRLTLFVLCIGCSGGCTPSYQNTENLTPGIFLEPLERPVLPAGESLRAISAQGLKLTKASEGFMPKLYNDAAGYCTIAYGHLIYKMRCNGGEPAEFKSKVTEPRGEELLLEDMTRAQYVVMTAVSVKLTASQFAALCDFVYNVGARLFRSSTLLKKINNSEMDQVPIQLLRWVLANGKPYPGLIKRRECEIELFFDGLPKPRALPPATEDTGALDIRKGES